MVVGWHWNFEYKRAPSALEESEGKAAIDAGADIVFAHHPHLLDGVEAYHGGLIVYSLGNLVFSGFSGETAETVLVRAIVTERRHRRAAHPRGRRRLRRAVPGQGLAGGQHPAARQEPLRGPRHEREDRPRQRVRPHRALGPARLRPPARRAAGPGDGGAGRRPHEPLHWTAMRPILFQIGDFRFYSFGLMAALALIVPGTRDRPPADPSSRRRAGSSPTSSSSPPEWAASSARASTTSSRTTR